MRICEVCISRIHESGNNVLCRSCALLSGFEKVLVKASMGIYTARERLLMASRFAYNLSVNDRTFKIVDFDRRDMSIDTLDVADTGDHARSILTADEMSVALTAVSLTKVCNGFVRAHGYLLMEVQP